jgi:hypothetical protein
MLVIDCTSTILYSAIANKLIISVLLFYDCTPRSSIGDYTKGRKETPSCRLAASRLAGETVNF